MRTVFIRDHDDTSESTSEYAAGIFEDACRAASVFGIMLAESDTYFQAYCPEHADRFFQDDACFVGKLEGN